VEGCAPELGELGSRLLDGFSDATARIISYILSLRRVGATQLCCAQLDGVDRDVGRAV
jgi:hypothetical protein